MLGAPASGKGSVAEILSAEYNIPAISSGDIFRKNIQEQTELGIKANEYITKGQLVPDDITVSMIKDRLTEDDTKNGMILDGFPRTVKQAEALDEMLKESGKKIDIVINLETPEEEILERITNRRICSNSDCKAVYNLVLHPSKVEGICDKCGSPLYQRVDDTLEKAKERLVVYYEQTAPLTKYYEGTGALYSTVLSQSVNRMKEEVSKDVIEYLKKGN
jgi:adenylate kinase